jgi:hypothetical protein
VKRTLCRFGIGDERISREFRMGFAKSGITGSAAPALDASLTEVTKLLAGLVLAFGAGHRVSPIAFCGETSQNTFGLRRGSLRALD